MKRGMLTKSILSQEGPKSVTNGQVEPSATAVFHWIRVARAVICSLATTRWTTAISRVQENLASQKLLVKVRTSPQPIDDV